MRAGQAFTATSSPRRPARRALALEAHRQLAGAGDRCRIVPMPSWELSAAQSAEYRHVVLPPAIRMRVSVEAGSPSGWERCVGPAGAITAVDRFGASAPGNELMAHSGFTVEHVVATGKSVLARDLVGEAPSPVHQRWSHDRT
jgi:transketolase